MIRFALTLGFLLGGAPAPCTGDDALIQRLKDTEASNLEQVVDGQFETSTPANGFKVGDPYEPDRDDIVAQWFGGPERAEAVCALRFSGPDQDEYQLRDFASDSEAESAGFVVTHYGRCGSCSTLQDLAVYLDVRDLTTPARACARRWGMQRKKQCFTELGFTSTCAESWAYNARHTRESCSATCLSDYGFFNVLVRRYPGPNVDDSGKLRPCLQCDESESGPGFQYSAGRTRRNSGIESAIERPSGEIMKLDHDRYFDIGRLD